MRSKEVVSSKFGKIWHMRGFMRPLFYIDCFKQLPHDHSHLDMGKLLRRSLSIHVRASLLMILATRFGDLLACSSSHRSSS